MQRFIILFGITAAIKAHGMTATAAPALKYLFFTKSTITDITAIAMLMANTACSTDWPYLVPIDLPILLISGAKDPVGLNGKGVIAVCDNLEDAGIRPQVILYPGMRHEILNETEHEKVYQDILTWLGGVIDM